MTVLTADLPRVVPLGTGETQEKWAVAGTPPAKGWILLRQSVQRTIGVKTLPFNDYAIGDRDSHALTSGIFLADTYGDGSPIVTPGAEAVCITASHPGQSAIARVLESSNGSALALILFVRQSTSSYVLQGTRRLSLQNVLDTTL